MLVVIIIAWVGGYYFRCSIWCSWKPYQLIVWVVPLAPVLATPGDLAHTCPRPELSSDHIRQSNQKMGLSGLSQCSPLLRPSIPCSLSGWVPEISVLNQHLKSLPIFPVMDHVYELGLQQPGGQPLVAVWGQFPSSWQTFPRGMALPLTTMRFRTAM